MWEELDGDCLAHSEAVIPITETYCQTPDHQQPNVKLPPDDKLPCLPHHHPSNALHRSTLLPSHLHPTPHPSPKGRGSNGGDYSPKPTAHGISHHANANAGRSQKQRTVLAAALRRMTRHEHDERHASSRWCHALM